MEEKGQETAKEEKKPVKDDKETVKDVNPQPAGIDEEKQKLLEMSEISLWLDNYDDIFSDFDPRPYSQRALSDDFLSEAKKACREKPSGGTELKLLVPPNERNVQEEKIIKTRLKEHFGRQSNSLKKEIKNMVKHGLLFSIAGIFLMLIATFLMVESNTKDMIISFFIILLEPAGWFLFWEGLDIVVFDSKKIKPELEFYKKISKCTISFLSY